VGEIWGSLFGKRSQIEGAPQINFPDQAERELDCKLAGSPQAITQKELVG
jgi:hypothetical protein